jgi:hypothetical protein
MINARKFFTILLLAALFIPLFFSIPTASSQSTGTTTTMTISQPASQGQCAILTLGFTARAGEQITGTFGSDTSVNFYILSPNDLGAIQNCQLNPAVKAIFIEENSVGHDNPYRTLSFPTNGTYYFVFTYKRSLSSLPSGYATVELSYPSSISFVGATGSVSVPATSTVGSLTSTVSSLTSTVPTMTTTVSQVNSSISVAVSSQPIQSTSAMVASTASSGSSILGISLTSLLAVIGGVVVVAGVLIWAALFRNKKTHTLSSYLTKIDSTFNQYAVDREECKTRLEKIKSDVIEMLNKRQIDEGHFLMLDEKISQYQKELNEATPKYQRPSASDETGAGSANNRGGQSAGQVRTCGNCGAKLLSDEKVCGKCGAAQ